MDNLYGKAVALAVPVFLLLIALELMSIAPVILAVIAWRIPSIV
jgi:hypothetical protein